MLKSVKAADFPLNLLPKYELEREEESGERRYRTPDGIFPSVTTVIGKYYKKDLSGWIQRVGGPEAAERVKQRAADNGTLLHAILEKALYNEDWAEGQDSIDVMRFTPVFRKKLLPNVTRVYGSEYPLWSKSLGTAGTTDGIVDWNGEQTILDLKTTMKYKQEEWVSNYFCQAACYALMANEIYKMNITRLVLIFSQDNFQCYHFEKNLSEWVDEVHKVFNGTDSN